MNTNLRPRFPPIFIAHFNYIPYLCRNFVRKSFMTNKLHKCNPMFISGSTPDIEAHFFNLRDYHLDI